MAKSRRAKSAGVELEKARRALLAQLLEAEGVMAPQVTAIPQLGERDGAPLSFAQERLCFLDQFQPGSAYNLCRAYRLRGRLDIERLSGALHEIVRRHEILRAVFSLDDGQPVQRATAAEDFRIRRVDLRAWPVKQRAARSQRILDDEPRRVFNLATGPLFGVTLIGLENQLHILLISAHQIIFDGASLEILYRELEALYRRGAEDELTELTHRYGDYAEWQRQALANERSQAPLAYWKGRLSGAPPALDLPADRRRPATPSSRGARRSIVISPKLTAALKKLSRSAATTLFVTLMAAFKILLYRYSGQADIVVGYPRANRDRTEFQGLIGCFVDMLPLRSDFAGAPPFRELLARVRAGFAADQAHRDVPFERIVDALHGQRDLSRNPIFQVMFGFQHNAGDLHLPGLTCAPIELATASAKFDLTLSLAEKDGALNGFFEYSSDLFAGGTIDRMAKHFRNLLKAIVADPDKPINALALLSAAERRQLLVEWNDTQAKYPRRRTVVELFEAQAKRTPNAIAVVFGNRQLRYRELNLRANRLAHYLKKFAIGREDRVAICLDRSIEMVIALLAVLKAGAAYVPLDPEYPLERLAFILDDAQASILISQKRVAEDRGLRIGDGESPRKVILLDRDRQKIGKQRAVNSKSKIQPRYLAYVIYTSGSTGQPKGVEIEHGSLVNCLLSMRRQLNVSQRDVWLAVTTISFDIAAAELLVPLISGAKLVIASRDEARDGERLARRLAKPAATLMQATPSSWRLLLEAGWQGAVNLTMLLGGEALPRQLADRLITRGKALWNFYGPTETTIWSMSYRVDSGEGPVPIGRPLANTEIYLLDDRLQPAPIGVPGEIFIGGAGVARGYSKLPALTAEKFIDNPFHEHADSRLYRTGDIGKYLPSGDIEFLGRSDNQVKIRGHRIELGEIEAALGRNPLVRQCVVVAHSASADSKLQISNFKSQSPVSDAQLVAYVVPSALNPIDAAELQNFLRQTLPEFMVPAQFSVLEALPLTPNGKIDRKVLPPPDGGTPSVARRFVAPRSEVEELVAQLWRDVLGVDEISVYDNFFDLGGHSLLATRVAARLCANFNIELPLRQLFELPTLAALALHVADLRRTQNGLASAPIVVLPRHGDLPLSSAQLRLWFLHQLEPESGAYNIPAAYRIHGRLDVAALASALNAMIARHESLRTAIVETKGQPAQRILPEAEMQLSVLDFSECATDQADEEVLRLIAADARMPYDLARAPLVRAKLLRLADDEHVLLLNFHHIIVDASALVDFYRELALLYESCAKGSAISLPALPVQFADYAIWQQAWLGSAAAEAQLAYWKRQLGGSLTPLDLSADWARTALASYRGARVVQRLPRELTAALKELSRRQGATLFMTLLAAFDILLARLAGREDIVVGSTIAGRNRPELDGVVGFFINALALRSDLSGRPSFSALLKRVRDVCLEGYAHQELPFDKVVEALNPERDLSRNPLFQVMFNMNDASERTLKLIDCRTEKISQSEPAAKFDIVLYAPEINGSIELAMVYNAELFSAERVTIYMEQLSALLDQIVAAPEQTIDRYSLRTTSTERILPDPVLPLGDQWQGKVAALVSEQAKARPHALALLDDSGDWNYAEIDGLSDQLANCLDGHGIDKGDVVAIHGQRNASLAIALLGVLKAGAVFVVLDPAYPTARLLDYLRIAKPKAWLQLAGAVELPDELGTFLAASGLRCRLNLPTAKDEIADALASYESTAPEISIGADDPAYIAFTSGSTGQPKGVLCRHGPMSHFLPWQEKEFALISSDRYCLLSGLGYNHLQRELFTALTSGAALYIPSAAQMKSVDELITWLREHRITILHLTPALGRLLHSAGAKPLPNLRRIFFGGDLLTRQDVAAMRALAPNAKIVSFYGATETQRAVGYLAVEDDGNEAAISAHAILPTGRGVPDVQLLLLTPQNQPAGVGELGELFVRSPHLAICYVDDESLTAANFLVNPFTGESKDRLYRTGELGRYRPDGNVEWVGRRDRRVNIRGFRVELAEVESTLLQHPAVREVAVAVNSNFKIPISKLSERLVAYVVADDAAGNLFADLRGFLAAKLPHYMVPADFVRLARLPLSFNGKVDHAELPRITQTRTTETPFDPPSTPLEQSLAAMFSEVLGVERIGRLDDFFHCGGHSLLAAQVAARIRESLGARLDLRVFMESPTVAALADRIDVARREHGGACEREEFEL